MDFKPLLHTWSLSVEEQYYLIWVALSVVLGWLSWRFIELPFREKRWLAGRKPVLVGGLIMIAGAGQAIRSADGVTGRLSGQAMQYAQARDWQMGQMGRLLQRNSPDLKRSAASAGWPRATDSLVWGDSYAAALLPAIKADAQRFATAVWLASLSGCLPILGQEVRQQCQDFNQQTL